MKFNYSVDVFCLKNEIINKMAIPSVYLKLFGQQLKLFQWNLP